MSKEKTNHITDMTNQLTTHKDLPLSAIREAIEKKNLRAIIIYHNSSYASFIWQAGYIGPIEIAYSKNSLSMG